MPSASKSNRQKTKQQRQVKQPTRNWLELPGDVMADIICRVGVFDILENAQNLCTAWRKICKDPAMWRVINIRIRPLHLDIREVHAMCKHAVDRSQGQLIDITMGEFCDDELLLYIADRSSQLKRLKILWCFYESLTEALKRFPLLEELDLYCTKISKEAIEVAGRYCPMLKTLNRVGCRLCMNIYTDEESIMIQNQIAIAIGENLHELEHLQRCGDIMSNIGLQAILDGCRHLKSLGLCKCLYLDLKGDLGKRCSQQIKCLKLPDSSLKKHRHIHESPLTTLMAKLG